MAASRCSRSKQSHVQRLEFSLQGLHFTNSPSGLCQLVSHEVPKPLPLHPEITILAGQEVTYFAQGQTEGFGPLDELESTYRTGRIYTVASLRSLRRPKHPRLL